MASPENFSGYGVFVPPEVEDYSVDTELIPTIDLQSLIVGGTSKFIRINEALVQLEQEEPTSDLQTADIIPINLRPNIIRSQFASEIVHPISNEELYAMFTPEDLRGVILLASAIELGHDREEERDALIQGMLRGMAIERKKEQLDKEFDTDPDLKIIRDAVEQFPIDDTNRYRQAS